MESTFYKPLTPSFRNEIQSSIDGQIRELEQCQSNAFVNIQIASLQAHKTLFNALPDGYPVPCTRNK